MSYSETLSLYKFVFDNWKSKVFPILLLLLFFCDSDVKHCRVHHKMIITIFYMPLSRKIILENHPPLPSSKNTTNAGKIQTPSKITNTENYKHCHDRVLNYSRVSEEWCWTSVSGLRFSNFDSARKTFDSARKTFDSLYPDIFFNPSLSRHFFSTHLKNMNHIIQI